MHQIRETDNIWCYIIAVCSLHEMRFRNFAADISFQALYNTVQAHLLLISLGHAGQSLQYVMELG
ncbi:hypothetical protein KC19_VG166500 [Ceratodon purpureus]|uniref:Uncharacterized protein n=1 Tax=Ceratodon purpureus TaxID=3225 RepID=A0A8T0HR94_CERPU|nr:hypothetical protein KC19_VG166500 [Ceratodon purpureus]